MYLGAYFKGKGKRKGMRGKEGEGGEFCPPTSRVLWPPMHMLAYKLDHITVLRTHVAAAVNCQRPSIVVCRSVCLSPSEPAKTDEAIEMPFALRTRVSPRKHLQDIAEHFQPNTVLWALHTIQPSSSVLLLPQPTLHSPYM